jgi:hypothetical protein
MLVLLFQDEPGNGTFYGVAEYLSTEQRNHVKMENSDIELGDTFGSGPGMCDPGAGVGTTTELLEKQDTTVTLVTGGERRRSAKNSDAHGDVFSFLILFLQIPNLLGGLRYLGAN